MSRIAILAHSTNPRGGVVHALELAEALTRLGHDATLYAPDARGTGFFRTAQCETVAIPAQPAPPDLAAMVAQRVQEYGAYFSAARCASIEIFHAQDSISANALAALKQNFARTVHHIDDFDDPRLIRLQHHGITSAKLHFTVSRQWQNILATEYKLHAQLTGNGVDTKRFTPTPNMRDAALRTGLGLGPGPIMLSIGGIEPRKNTIALLRAFCALRQYCPNAQWILAGGASLLDHATYRQDFYAALTSSGLPAEAVLITGTMPQRDMPSLYRIADVFAFPSLKEGFGLAVLEAMASGIPAIVPHGAPFDEYIGENDAAWCDPHDPTSITQALLTALTPASRANFGRQGQRIAARHNWARIAQCCLTGYATLQEPANA